MSLFKFFQSRKAPAQTASSTTPEQVKPDEPPAIAPPPAATNQPVANTSVIPNVGVKMSINYGQPSMSWGMKPPVAPPPPSSATVPELFEQAQNFHKQGQLQKALPLYQQVLEKEPQHFHTLHYQGLLHVQSGHAEQGIALIQQSIAIQPQQFAALGNLAGALQDLGRHEEALRALEQALALKDDVAELWSNRGNLEMSLQRLDAAVKSYQRAIQLKPQLITAGNHLSIALCMLGQYEASLLAIDEALKHAANAPHQLADLHDTRGSTLRRLGRKEDALQAYQQAMALKPDQLSYLANRCSVLEDMDRYEEAIADLLQIRERDPQFKCVNGRLLHAKRRCLDWVDIDSLTAQVVQSTREGVLSDAPLNMLAVSEDASVQLACAQQAMADQGTIARTRLQPRTRQPGEKIRIAYVSADLREHAVSYLMAGVFETHDRARFEITAISLKPAEDSPMGRRVQSAFDSFLDVSHWSDDQIVAHMRQHQYDIAIDLMGLTFGARPGIWAQGITPIQINYLGYPGTTGSPYMDVILADDTVIPPEQQDHYSEKVVYLPECFQANDRQRLITDATPTRAELGLPQEAFVFCAFNNLYKIGPSTFDSWARILSTVPGSVLWLVDDQDVARRHAQQEMHARGIDPSRLIFAKRTNYPDHLARIKQADLFLDTLPFNAGTTASDALWSGLPLITRSGQAFASRMAASLLKAVGLPELITATQADYEALAIELANHPARLQTIRQKLHDQRLTCTLFDTERFTRNLELAYQHLIVSA